MGRRTHIVHVLVRFRNLARVWRALLELPNLVSSLSCLDWCKFYYFAGLSLLLVRISETKTLTS